MRVSTNQEVLVASKPLGTGIEALKMVFQYAKLGHARYGIPLRKALEDAMRWANLTQKYGYTYRQDLLDIYHKRRAEKLCVDCGRPMQSFYNVRCENCLARRRNYYARRKG
jgi:hypothetical protein